MTLDSYIQSLRGKSIAVIGLGVSNRPLLRLLLDAGIPSRCAINARARLSARTRPQRWKRRAAVLCWAMGTLPVSPRT